MPRKTSSKKGAKPFARKFFGLNKNAIVVIVAFAVVGTIFTISSFAATAVPQIKPNSRFAWLLQGTPNETVMDNETGPKVYNFDYQHSNAEQIARIKAKGIKVICYFSAGTDEDWRPDHSQFKAGDTFGQLPGWEGELIVDTRSTNVRNIMYNRIQTMSSLGCDGIEPDNIDAYTNSSSIPLNETTTLDYMQFLTDAAHSFNMAIALKNGGELIDKKLPNGTSVVNAFDFSLVEQCYEYQECDTYKPFIAAGKAVFIVEYSGSASSWAAGASCKDANSKNFDAYLMNLNLSGPRTPCRTSGGDNTTPTPPANQPPIVAITSPANGQQFASGSAVTLSVNAADSDGSIKQVQFFNGASSIATDTAAPYNTTLSGLAPGTYTFRALATDNNTASNNTATSTVTITILSPSTPTPPANALPSVSLQGISGTFEAPASFTLTAGANDSDGTVSRVEFYNGATKIGEDSTAPYAFGVSKYPAGSYTFTARATDNGGASKTSNAVTTIVTNPAPTTPTPTPIPTTGAPVWPANATLKKGFDTNWWKNNCAFKTSCAIYVNWPAATDDKRVAGYEVWRKANTGSYTKLYINSASDRYYSDKISKDKTYTYQIYAIDGNGNRTVGPSASVNIDCYFGVCRP